MVIINKSKKNNMTGKKCVYVREDIYRRFKVYVAKEGKKISETIDVVIDNFLKEQEL